MSPRFLDEDEDDDNDNDNNNDNDNDTDTDTDGDVDFLGSDNSSHSTTSLNSIPLVPRSLIINFREHGAIETKTELSQTTLLHIAIRERPCSISGRDYKGLE